MSSIAICVSGEVRTWFQSGKETLKYFISRLESNGHTVQVYGHTWKHCEIEKPDFFESLIIDDQQKLYDFINEDKITRVIYSSDVRTNYTNHTGDIALHIANSTAILGQIFAFHRVMRNAPVGHDIYIRWRWDNIFTDYLDEFNSHLTEEEKEAYIKLFIAQIESIVSIRSNFLSSHCDLVFRGMSNNFENKVSDVHISFVDFVFALDKHAHMKIHKDADFESHMFEKIKQSPVLSRPGTHQVWTYLMDRYKLRGTANLINIVCVDRLRDS